MRLNEFIDKMSNNRYDFIEDEHTYKLVISYNRYENRSFSAVIPKNTVINEDEKLDSINHIKLNLVPPEYKFIRGGEEYEYYYTNEDKVKDIIKEFLATPLKERYSNEDSLAYNNLVNTLRKDNFVITKMRLNRVNNRLSSEYEDYFLVFKEDESLNSMISFSASIYVNRIGQFTIINDVDPKIDIRNGIVYEVKNLCTPRLNKESVEAIAKYSFYPIELR